MLIGSDRNNIFAPLGATCADSINLGVHSAPLERSPATS